MAAKKKAAAPKPKAEKKEREVPVAGRYPIHPTARREDESDSEFEERRQAEHPKGVHDPVLNKCEVCGEIPPQRFELKLQDEAGNLTTMHDAPAKPLAYQAMLAHYKQQHPDAKVPRAYDEQDIPEDDLLQELLDRTRDSEGHVVDPKAKSAEFAA